MKPGPAAALHADASQRRHFRAVALAPRTLALGTAVIAAAAVLGALGLGIWFGAGAAALALLFVLAGIWAVADVRAAEDFHRAYAAARSLELGLGRVRLPSVTSLLRQGVRRYADPAFAGNLPGDTRGLLGLFTYETETTDSRGNRHVQHHHFTVALVRIPEAARFIGHLACQRRSGFSFLDDAEDLFRDRQRVETESEALDERCEIFIGEGDDMGHARQLFSPTFIDWLVHADEKLAFELEDAMLVCNRPGHLDSAAELDAFCETAAKVAERISDEALESHGAHAVKATGTEFSRLVATAKTSPKLSRLRVRMGALVALAGIPIGLGIGFAADKADEGGSTRSESRNVYELGDPELEELDQDLLPVVARLDGPGGVHTDDLYGHGVDPVVVGDWISDAYVRGVIDFDVENRSMHITPKGERAIGG